LSLEKAIEIEVAKFVKNGLKSIKELTAKQMVQEASINPFLVKALGITDFDSLSRFYVYQRIGRSLVTSFGMTVMESFVKTLGGGKKGQWWDINLSKGSKNLYISVKSGPRDMDADQVRHFSGEARALLKRDENAVPLIAMCYGKEPLGPIAATLRQKGFDPAKTTLTGKELYETLTGEPNYHIRLLELTGKKALDTLQEKKFIDIIEAKVKEIANDFRKQYKTLDDLLLDIF
jgi:hypothetical protein